MGRVHTTAPALPALLRRLASGVAIRRVSSTAFATVGTALTTLVILPLLDVAFDVLLGADMAAPDLVRIGYTAALVALMTSIVSGIVGTVATDRNLGVFQEVHTLRRVDLAYWCSAALVPALVSLVPAAAAVASVLVLSGAADRRMLVQALAAVPLAVACGVLLGIGVAGIGVYLPDPYLGGTLVGTFAPLLAGVIVPLAICPAWLRMLAQAVPLTAVLGLLDGGQHAAGQWGCAVAHDLLVGSAWAVVGLAATQAAIRALRSGARRTVV